MVPRTEIVGFYLEDSVEEHMKVIQNERYTRYPILEKIKMIYRYGQRKRFLYSIYDRGSKDLSSIRSYMRPIIEVMETTPIHDLLLQCRRSEFRWLFYMMSTEEQLEL